MSAQILPGRRISLFQHFKLLFQIFILEKSRRTTGNTISLTNFNETLTKCLLSSGLATRKRFIEILWADFSKMNFQDNSGISTFGSMLNNYRNPDVSRKKNS